MTAARAHEPTVGMAYIGTYHPCGCSPAAVYSKADQELVRQSVAFMLDRGMSVTRVPSKTPISACRHRDFLTGRPL